MEITNSFLKTSKAKNIIQEYEYVLHASAKLLMEKEKIGKEEFESLFRKEENALPSPDIVENNEENKDPSTDTL